MSLKELNNKEVMVFVKVKFTSLYNLVPCNGLFKNFATCLNYANNEIYNAFEPETLG